MITQVGLNLRVEGRGKDSKVNLDCQLVVTKIEVIITLKIK